MSDSTREELVEEDRVILAKGSYSLSPGELPYESTARAVVDALGSRPAPAETPSEDDVTALSLIFQRHYLDLDNSDVDGHNPCICGDWQEGEMEIGWDDHLAEVAVEAGYVRSPASVGEGEREELARWLSAQNWTDASRRMDPSAFWSSKADALRSQFTVTRKVVS